MRGRWHLREHAQANSHEQAAADTTLLLSLKLLPLYIYIAGLSCDASTPTPESVSWHCNLAPGCSRGQRRSKSLKSGLDNISWYFAPPNGMLVAARPNSLM